MTKDTKVFVAIDKDGKRYAINQDPIEVAKFLASNFDDALIFDPEAPDDDDIDVIVWHLGITVNTCPDPQWNGRLNDALMPYTMFGEKVPSEIDMIPLEEYIENVIKGTA